MRNPIDDKMRSGMAARTGRSWCHLVLGACIALLIILWVPAAHGLAESTGPKTDLNKAEGPAATGPQRTDLQGGTQIARRLWAGRISAPTPPDDTGSSDELRRLIAQIRAVQFEPRARPTRPAPIEQSVATKDLNDVTAPSDPNAPLVPGDPEREPNKLNQGRRTVGGLPERIESLLGDPNDVSDPFAVAELLYLSGQLKTAAVFYRSALGKMTTDDPQNAHNRAWAMFQLGNCLRAHDPSAATDAYLKLVAEYPNSPWTPLARARGRLISWENKTRPRTLIADAKP